MITDEGKYIETGAVNKITSPIKENNGNEDIYVIFIYSDDGEDVRTFDTKKEADLWYDYHKRAMRLFRDAAV